VLVEQFDEIEDPYCANALGRRAGVERVLSG